jgi:hypothetical protein
MLFIAEYCLQVNALSSAIPHTYSRLSFFLRAQDQRSSHVSRALLLLDRRELWSLVEVFVGIDAQGSVADQSARSLIHQLPLPGQSSRRCSEQIHRHSSEQDTDSELILAVERRQALVYFQEDDRMTSTYSYYSHSFYDREYSRQVRLSSLVSLTGQRHVL